MSKFYKQALSIIADGNFDARSIAIQLAQENPSLFMKFCSPKVQEPTVPNWFITNIVKICKNNPVQAIKNLREVSHIGLWEAKQVVNEIRHGQGSGDPKFILENCVNVQGWGDFTWRQLAEASRKYIP